MDKPDQLAEIRFTMELAGRIRDARLQSGLSQADLSRYIGVSRTALSQFERAMQKPSVYQVLRLEQAMGLDPLSLIPLETVEKDVRISDSQKHAREALLRYRLGRGE